MNRVNEEWFADVEAVRKAVGILEEPAPEAPGDTSKVRLRALTAGTAPSQLLCWRWCGHAERTLRARVA